MTSRLAALTASLLVSVVCAAGCRAIAGYGSAPTDTRRDVPPLDLTSSDMVSEGPWTPDRDNSTPDILTRDIYPTCGSQLPPPVLARYSFDTPGVTTMLSDGKKNIPADVHGAVSWTPGRPDCGQAVVFNGDPANYVVIRDTPPLRLSTGAIELWARLGTQAFTGLATLLSRDALGQAQAGHLLIAQDSSGVLGVRVQGQEIGSRKPEAFACVEKGLQINTWHHVIVSFGGGKQLEIYLDTVKGTFRGTLSASKWPCGERAPEANTVGIDGNTEPFVLGAGTSINPRGGDLKQLNSAFVGAIDELRIHDQRIDPLQP